MFRSFGQACDSLFSFGRFNNGGLIMMIIGVVLLLVVVYFVFKKGNFSGIEGRESPLDLLQKRYVNGEINEDEYLSKKDILKRMK